MGYESRIYIVDKTDIKGLTTKKKYAQLIARFDMGVLTPLAYKFQNMPKTDCYVYADDGNTQIIEDKYGEELTEASIAEVIAVLEKEVENGENYRRIFPLLATLKTLNEHKDQWKDLAVLHYGY